MTDDHDDTNFIKKYGMLSDKQIFDGLAYWEYSPLIYKPPYSLHWYGDKLGVWSPYKIKDYDYSVTTFEVDINNCDGLRVALEALKSEIKNSAAKMVDDGPEMYRTTMVMSPTFYKVKIFPPNMLGSMTLNSIEWDRLSWIKKAKSVKAIAESCR
ncbi:hypothetical protein [Kangiella sediminilitoris]|nr:hypothetical protein [Kangiella sediminilitoris]